MKIVNCFYGILCYLKTIPYKENIRKVDDIDNIFKNKTVAIVGNGPNISNNKNYGEMIDSHDLVIRINNGRIDLGTFSGKKTDIRLGGGVIDIPHMYNDILYKIIGFPFLKNNPFKKFFYKMIKNMDLRHNKIYFMNPLYWSEISKELGKSKYPTTGMIGIYYLYKINNFKKLSVFGFTFSLYNFHENKKKESKYSHHNLEKEKEIFFEKILLSEKICYFD